MKSTQEELFLRSKTLVPGGVHSPVRSFKGLTSTPRFIERGEGAYLWDVDGKDYIDFCMSFGPLILGHRHPEVEAELHEALKRGWSFGACEPYSLKLAEFLLEKLPFVDQLRFVNSGTEAVMTALRIVRGYTGRNKLIKFNGCYHGHMDSMLIKAGSGLAGEAEASSAGVPIGVSQDTLVLELGDLESLRACFERYPKEIAAIVIEPLPANNGLLIQEKEFLQGCRDLCDEFGSLLLFDEVISGFRVAFGGMAEKTGIVPDIVTYGKIIGGGLPVGAVAAKRKVMECLAPLGPVYQAGTLSANPLAMVAGLATLKHCTSEMYKTNAEQTKKITNLFRCWLAGFEGGKFSATSIVEHESLFWFYTSQNGKAPTNIPQIPSTLAHDFLPLFEELLKRGIYIAPNAYEVGFASFAHDDKICAELERRLFG